MCEPLLRLAVVFYWQVHGATGVVDSGLGGAFPGNVPP